MALWDKQAKKWENIGPPLRPSLADVQASSSWINEITLSNEKPLTVLLLGVTPEIVNIAWPKNTKFLAMDYNIAMIKHVLPSQAMVKPFACVGNWLRLPVLSSSIDLVIGDGCYNALAKNHYAIMAEEICRVLNSTGRFIIRFFTRPENKESIEVIRNDFLSGKIKNFHILKWRLAMALHGTLSEGVSLREIWNCWAKDFKKNNQAIFQQLQWSEKVLQTIDNYKNSDVYYTFPTLQEVRTILKNYFNELDIYIPDYPLGERCPTLNFQPR